MNNDDDEDDDQIEPGSPGASAVNSNPPTAQQQGNRQTAASERGGRKRRKTKKSGAGAGRGQGFTEAEQYTMLELIEELKPIGSDQWDIVTDRFNRIHPNPGRAAEVYEKNLQLFTGTVHLLVTHISLPLSVRLKDSSSF